MGRPALPARPGMGGAGATAATPVAVDISGAIRRRDGRSGRDRSCRDPRSGERSSGHDGFGRDPGSGRDGRAGLAGSPAAGGVACHGWAEAPSRTGRAPSGTGRAPSRTGEAPSRTGGAPSRTGRTLPPSLTGEAPPPRTGGTVCHGSVVLASPRAGPVRHDSAAAPGLAVSAPGAGGGPDPLRADRASDRLLVSWAGPAAPR